MEEVTVTNFVVTLLKDPTVKFTLIGVGLATLVLAGKDFAARRKTRREIETSPLIAQSHAVARWATSVPKESAGQAAQPKVEDLHL